MTSSVLIGIHFLEAHSFSISEYSTLNAIYLFTDILADGLFMAYLLASVAYLKCNIEL